ncbi:MAG: subclass B3 metallo-beta-lactamase [Verrucomicrobia bacterium]|nr:subclass B3 metallo-beta-lactamase [Verrucomicrobiota bacterium]
MSLTRTLCLALLFATAFECPAQTPSVLPPPPDRAAVKRMFDPWRAPVPPRHLLANVHYVGAVGVSSFLITTPAGHFLLDTGFEDTVPIIQRGVEALGFKLTDIKFILSSHAHIDHVAGHARMKKLTGALVVASAGDTRALESGGEDDYIQWPKDSIVYAPVKVDRIVADGERLTLGGTTLTAHLTPGHTRGATTWTMDVTQDGRARHVVFFSSATINAGTRLVNNPLFPDFVEQFEATFAKLKSLPCDIFFAPHGDQFGMTGKFSRLDRGENESPLVDPAGWQRLIAGTERAFRAQLSLERSLSPR